MNDGNSGEAIPKAPKAQWGVLHVDDSILQKGGHADKAAYLNDRDYDEGAVLPALTQATWPLCPAREVTLHILYTETCAAWRTLTDVRFKLLGLLPVASIAALVAIWDRGDKGPKLAVTDQIAASAFGLVVVSGLWIYEQRNTKLYDDLVGRGRRIEAELGIHTGCFRGRPKSTCPVEHDVAIHLIYGASICVWLFSLIRLL